MIVNILEGDVFETIKNIPDCSIQCVVTSPPYYGLRDYSIDGQIGLEETPEEYIAKLVAVFREVRRVLKDDGVLWLNLGDSYARQAGDDSTKETDSGIKTGRTGKSEVLFKQGNNKPPAGLKPKDLLMIPARVALALQADGWWLRSEIVWHKPNPMPESVTDRPTKSHEMVYLLAKSARYYYDAEAIKEPAVTPIDSKARQSFGGPKLDDSIKAHAQNNGKAYHDERSCYRNRRDVWTVATKPYKEAHFATFPPALIEPCVLAGSREGDTVLDPFSGSGTTGEVAIKHGRNYIGCEINPEYIKLTWKRLSKVQIQFSV